MTDYQRTLSVTAEPEAAFAFLSDPQNLPRYVATLTTAEPNPDGTLRVAADVQGRHEEGNAYFRTDPQNRRIEWSAPGSNPYAGSLELSPTADGTSVTIRIHLAREQDETEINRVLDQTQTNIQQLLANA